MTLRMTALVALAAAVSGSGAQAADEIKLTPARVSSYRSTNYLKPNNKAYSQKYLSLIVRIKGADIAKATRIGKLNIDEASDDKGNALELQSSLYSKRMGRVNRTSYSGGDRLSREEIDYSINLTGPAKTATKLAVLKGSLTIAVGETKSATIPVTKLAGLKGKTVEIQALKAMGLEVKVDTFRMKPGFNIRLRVTGKKEERAKLLQAEVVDAAGKTFRSGSFYQLNTFSTVSTSSIRPLPKGAKLKIVIETGSKEKMLSFSFKDLALP